MTERPPSTLETALRPMARLRLAASRLGNAAWELLLSAGAVLVSALPERLRRPASRLGAWIAAADDPVRLLHMQWFFALSGLCVFLAIGIDIPLARAVHALPDWVTLPFKAVTDVGKSTPYLITGTGLFLYLLFIYRARNWAIRALYVTLTVAVSGILVNILKFVFGRARPKLLFREEPESGFAFFGMRGDWQSFPSGHTSTVVALAFGAYVLFPRWWKVWLVFGAFFASTRVMSGNHFLSDIVAGAYVTILTALWLQKAFEARGYALRIGDPPRFRGLISGGGKPDKDRAPPVRSIDGRHPAE